MIFIFTRLVALKYKNLPTGFVGDKEALGKIGGTSIELKGAFSKYPI